MSSMPVFPTDHVLGPASAKVTVIEYADFECPYCHQAYGAVKIMLDTYKNRIRFVYRHFPLVTLHPHAELAAEAAEAAGGQDKFWPMHDVLFEHQHKLKANALRQYAAMLELDLTRFDYELSDHVYLQRVREHQNDALKHHIRSMPAFFLNGELQDVTFGMERLITAIDAKLRA